MNYPLSLDAIRRAEYLHRKLLELSFHVTRQFFEFGRIMKEIRDNELWRNRDCSSFEEYYNDPDLSYGRSSVYNAIYLVERFPKWEKVLNVPIRKLTMIAPHITENNKEKLLEYASSLSSSDLRYQLDQDGLRSDSVQLGMPKIYRCKDCKLVKGVFFPDLCKCGWTKDQIERVQSIINEVNSI